MAVSFMAGQGGASPLGFTTGAVLGWDEVTYYTEPAYCFDPTTDLHPSEDPNTLIELDVDPGAGTASLTVWKSSCGTMSQIGDADSFTGCAVDAAGAYACGNPAVINDATVWDHYLSLEPGGWLFYVLQLQHPDAQDDENLTLTEKIAGATAGVPGIFGPAAGPGEPASPPSNEVALLPKEA